MGIRPPVSQPYAITRETKVSQACVLYVARFLHLRDDGCGPLSWVYHSSDMVLAAAVDILGGHSNFRLIRERERERKRECCASFTSAS